MFTTKILSRTITFVTVFILALSGAQAAYAAPPANDNFAGAAVVTSLPFSVTVDNTDASLESGEPQNCYFMTRTVWYSFTPAETMVVRANNDGSSIPSNLNVYQALGSGISDLNFLSCTVNYGPVTFLAEAGQTYYIQAGDIFGDVGNIQINLEEVPPPANDAFTNATGIPSIPFDDVADTSAATLETGEPTPSCAYYGTINRSVWYSYTPAANGTVSASLPTVAFTPVFAAYTGNALNSLTEIGCQYYSGNLLTLAVTAGNTYYFQVGNLYPWELGGSMQFHLDVPPPPVASFFFSPFDPSVFDTIQFYNNSYDPANVGIQSVEWDFGDGTAASADSYPTHKYSADGDYTVKLTVTTFDGRTASVSQVVQVRTHDVAITKISAPKTAKAGQTRAITIFVKNQRYGENVQVDLYKSVPGGFQWIGGYTQFVQVLQGNQTTIFTFNYTFTNDDASLGKVSFKAIATILDARDPIPADNELISSPPTKVLK